MYSSRGRHFSSGGHFIHFYCHSSFDDQGLTGGVPTVPCGMATDQIQIQNKKNKSFIALYICKKDIKEKCDLI